MRSIEANKAVVKYTDDEVDLLARLMRAEALGEGRLGMLMVGNVVINRVIGNCFSFRNIHTIKQAIYQIPGGFAGVNSPLFSAPATIEERSLAMLCIMGYTFYPATNALWFYSPKEGEECLPNWYNQRNAGRYKNHCFYRPDPGSCLELY